MTTSPSALDALLSTLRTKEGVATAHIDDGWMQGRTAYGGISSAVALAGTKALQPNDAPLSHSPIRLFGPGGRRCPLNTRPPCQPKSSRIFVSGG